MGASQNFKKSLSFFSSEAKTLLIACAWVFFSTLHLLGEWRWDLSRVFPTPMVYSAPLAILITWVLLKMLQGIPRFRRWTSSVFFVYLILLFCVFLPMYPGCFTNDTLYTLHMVKNGWWGGWYSILHPWAITSMYQVIPIGDLAPILFLTGFWALLAMRMHLLLEQFRSPKWLHLGVPLTLALPSSLASIGVIVRDSFFTVGFLLVFTEFARVLLVKKSNRSEFLFFVALTSFLSFYRTEFVILGALMLIFHRKYNKQVGLSARDEKRAWLGSLRAMSPIFLVFVVSMLPGLTFDKNWIVGNSYEPRFEKEYGLTLIENPLSFIVKNKPQVITDADRDAITRVYTINELRTNYCPENICTFYSGAWDKNSTIEERAELFRVATKLFANNPDLYLQAKFATLATVGQKNIITACSAELRVKAGYPNFIPASLSIPPINIPGFIQATEVTSPSSFSQLNIWNPVPYIFILVAGAIGFVLSGQRALALLAGILVLRHIFVFISAPAGFTSYYWPLYSGFFTFFLFVAAYLARRPKASDRSSGE